MIEPSFLSRDEVLAIHRDQLEIYGGADGFVNEGAFDAAIGQARAVACYLQDADIFDVAAAYAFYISQDQPFLDGNKRTGLNAALTFLDMNGVPLPCVGNDYDELYEVMMEVAIGGCSRAGLALKFRSLVEELEPEAKA